MTPRLFNKGKAVRYVVETRWMGDTSYKVVSDTRIKVDGEHVIVCSEPLMFYAYPEGPFVETVNDSDMMQTITDLLNKG